MSAAVSLADHQTLAKHLTNLHTQTHTKVMDRFALHTLVMYALGNYRHTNSQLTWHTVSFFPEVLVCWDMLESTDCVSDASASAAAGLSRPFPNKPWETQ